MAVDSKVVPLRIPLAWNTFAGSVVGGKQQRWCSTDDDINKHVSRDETICNENGGQPTPAVYSVILLAPIIESSYERSCCNSPVSPLSSAFSEAPIVYFPLHLYHTFRSVSLLNKARSSSSSIEFLLALTSRSSFLARSRR